MERFVLSASTFKANLNFHTFVSVYLHARVAHFVRLIDQSTRAKCCKLLFDLEKWVY